MYLLKLSIKEPPKRACFTGKETEAMESVPPSLSLKASLATRSLCKAETSGTVPVIKKFFQKQCPPLHVSGPLLESRAESYSCWFEGLNSFSQRKEKNLPVFVRKSPAQLLLAGVCRSLPGLPNLIFPSCLLPFCESFFPFLLAGSSALLRLQCVSCYKIREAESSDESRGGRGESSASPAG